MFPPTGAGSGLSGSSPLDAILARGASLMQQPRPFRRAPGQMSSIPEGPDLYAMLDAGDPEGDSRLRAIYTETRQASLEARNNLEMSWWKKLLYVDGHQWIYNTGRGEWRDKRLARWIPRPVTNICAETISSIRAMLTGVQPSARIRPNGTDPKAVITAQLLDDLEPAIAEEHRMKTRWFEADFWAPTLGCCWLHPHWDRDDTTNEVFITAKQCAECGMMLHPLDLDEDDFMGCPQCGAPPEVFQDAVDPNTGEPIGQAETVGGGRTLVVSPLEILIPTYVQRWEDVDRLIYLRWRPESYYRGRPYAEQIRMTSSTAESSLEMYRSLATTTDLARGPFLTASASAQTRVKGAIEAELWVKPCADFPQGLWARMVGGNHGESVIIRDEDRGVLPGPLPYETKKGVKLWPWVYYPYELVGGRLYPKGALDPILTKQDAINQGDSMVSLIMQRMANPVWLEPKGSEVNRFTGEPGLIVRYQVMAGTQAKPERLDGMAPNQVFFQLREQHFSDAERLVGTQDVLKGMKPGGVEAFSALNLLVERSQSRFTSLFSARGEAYRVWLELAIELERSYGPDARVRSIAGPNNTWTFKQFLNADLQGAIQVIIEDGSTTPKTSLGKRAMLQEAKGMGFINAENPDTQYAALELLGGTALAPGLNAHTKAAQIEQELYVQWVKSGRQGPSPLVVRNTQAHPIHIQQLDLWANTDSIATLMRTDPLVADEITLHRIEHTIAMANPLGVAKVTPAMLASLMPMGDPNAPGGQLGPPAPGQAEGAGRALLNSGQESNAVDTLPGAAPGGGNMDQPA